MTNNGTVDVEDEVTLILNDSGATMTNAGSFSVGVGSTVNFGTNSVFTQAAGVLSNQGEFLMVSDTFNFDGGSLSGNAPILYG
ncbi:hypothetical protein LCGC14_2717970, partial [marine sediment metagenome]